MKTNRSEWFWKVAILKKRYSEKIQQKTSIAKSIFTKAVI